MMQSTKELGNLSISLHPIHFLVCMCFKVCFFLYVVHIHHVAELVKIMTALFKQARVLAKRTALHKILRGNVVSEVLHVRTASRFSKILL